MTEKPNKIALFFSDDKRLQPFDRIKLYMYGTSAGKVCKEEMLQYVKLKKLDIKDDQFWKSYRKQKLFLFCFLLPHQNWNQTQFKIHDHPKRILIMKALVQEKQMHCH